MKTRLSIDDVKPGMFLVDIDRSWLNSPFLWHRFRLKTQRDIDQLKACGVREVWIDPDKSVAQGTDSVDEKLVDGKNVWSGIKGAQARLQEREESGGDSSADSGKPSKSGDVEEIHTGLERRTPYLRITKDPSSSEMTTAGCQAEQMGESEETQPSPHVELSSEEKEKQELAMAQQILKDASVAVENVFEGAKTGARINAEQTRAVVDGLLAQVIKTQRAMFHQIQIQAIRQFDANLYTHVLDVSVLAMVLGQEGGLDQVSLYKLGMGALLHDVGQMRIPRNLYRKQGAFTPQERKLMQRHPELGVALLEQTPEIPDDVRRIVGEHHERFDGSGYPAKLAGKQISLFSQIVGIVDCYDGMLRRRGDRPALPPAQAVRELFRLGKNRQYDPVWTDRLIHLVGVYPLGSLVELQTGEQGVVVKENPQHRTMPMVRIISSECGRNGHFLDLAQFDSADGDVIRQVLDPVKEKVVVADLLGWG